MSKAVSPIKLDPQPADITALLRQLAGGPGIISGDEIEFRDDDLKLMTFPRGMTWDQAFEILQRKREEAETVTQFSRVFNFRPYDGANATAVVLKRRYGLTLGKTTPAKGMFQPPVPPQMMSIDVGPGKTRQVPWGRIGIPQMPGANLDLGYTGHSDYGMVFSISVESPRKHKNELNALFADIDNELKTGSIYRGQAVTGCEGPGLQYIEDLHKFRGDQIVFSENVHATLDAALFSVLRYPDAMRADNIPLKRAVLLHGPYGTGKTSVGMLVAQDAVAAGWTFVMARPGRDDVNEVLQTARLYAPAVVWVEDVDTDTRSSDPKVISKLLDTFDGISSKSGEIVMCMTTNHVDKIPPGMLRPGRLDYCIEIADLDAAATERLIRNVIGPDKLGDIDYEAVYSQMRDFLPAFVKATADRAKSWAITRLDGRRDYQLTTGDLVAAARSLHGQLELHAKALEVPSLPALDIAFRDAVRKGVNGMRQIDFDNDDMGHLAEPKAK